MPFPGVRPIFEQTVSPPWFFTSQKSNSNSLRSTPTFVNDVISTDFLFSAFSRATTPEIMRLRKGASAGLCCSAVVVHRQTHQQRRCSRMGMRVFAHVTRIPIWCVVDE